MTIPTTYICECFSLGEQGEVLWRERPLRHFPSAAGQAIFNAKHAGRPAGHARKDGYVVLKVMHQGRKHALFAHRVVWLLTHGEWPKHNIDHINRVRSDNRPENLRDVPQRTNCANRSDLAAGTGVVGVRRAPWNKNKFCAHIKFGRVSKYLGSFDSIEEASEARNAYLRENLQ